MKRFLGSFGGLVLVVFAVVLVVTGIIYLVFGCAIPWIARMLVTQ